MKAIVTLLIVATMAMATVRSGSSYMSDARLFDGSLSAVGIYAETAIIYKNNGYQYAAWFDGDWFDLEADADKVIAVMTAAALVSQSTSWRSSAAVCIFEDVVIAMTTSDCRSMVNMVNAGYSYDQVGYFFLTNAVIVDIGDTNWSRP